MRIRGGTSKGREILAPKGLITRPTSDKVKEAIFNVLAAKIPDAVVLDLCTGTGNLALEALSRGADRAVLVEKDSKVAKITSKNLLNTGLYERALLIKMDVLKALNFLSKESYTFDIIFFDPPYESQLYEPVLEFLAISKENLLSENAVIVVEASTRKILPENVLGIELKKESTYGDTKVMYYQ